MKTLNEIKNDIARMSKEEKLAMLAKAERNTPEDVKKFGRFVSKLHHEILLYSKKKCSRLSATYQPGKHPMLRKNPNELKFSPREKQNRHLLQTRSDIVEGLLLSGLLPDVCRPIRSLEDVRKEYAEWLPRFLSTNSNMKEFLEKECHLAKSQAAHFSCAESTQNSLSK